MLVQYFKCQSVYYKQKYVYEQDICYNDKKSEKRENFPSSILKSGILDKGIVFCFLF